MPYIEPMLRAAIDIGDAVPTNAGELNYKFTTLLKEYVEFKGLSYQTINDIVGALEGAKLEFYSKIARPYEDKKEKENGTVW